MKHTMKKPSYYLLSQAMDGDEKAIEKILAFYDPYISKCCLRPLYDEYGNYNVWWTDEEMQKYQELSRADISHELLGKIMRALAVIHSQDKWAYPLAS